MKGATGLPTGETTRSHAGSILVATALLVGWIVVAVFGAYNRINELAQQDAPAAAEQMVLLTRIVAFAFNLGVLAVGAWILWSGYRICRQGQFPLPGMKLLRSLGTCTGRKAQVIGSVAEIAGLLVLILGTTVTWLFVELSQTLLRN